jgi:hypothetical protein
MEIKLVGLDIGAFFAYVLEPPNGPSQFTYD